MELPAPPFSLTQFHVTPPEDEFFAVLTGKAFYVVMPEKVYRPFILHLLCDGSLSKKPQFCFSLLFSLSLSTTRYLYSNSGGILRIISAFDPFSGVVSKATFL